MNSNTKANEITNEMLTSKNDGPADMTAGCCVCTDDQGVEGNPLVYCDGCDVAVHVACYGISRVPAGSWFCSKCESGEPKQNIKCKLCPSTGGAYKRTEDGHWAHVVCALYIPEIRFGDDITMEPIEICHVKAERWTKTCYICTEKMTGSEKAGAKIDCRDKECKKSFHVTCAQSLAILCEQMNSRGKIYYCGFCEPHFRKYEAEKVKDANLQNSSSSPSIKSASDPSQDNDSKCNTSKQDKNNLNLTSPQKSSNNNNSNTNHNINNNNNINKSNSPPKTNSAKTNSPQPPTSNSSAPPTTKQPPHANTLLTTISATTTPTGAAAATTTVLTTSATTTSANITTTTMTPPPQTTASSIDMQEIQKQPTSTNLTSSNDASSIPLTNDQANSLLNSPNSLGSKTQLAASTALVTQSGHNSSENVHQTSASGPSATSTKNTSNTDESKTDTHPTVPPIIIPVPKNTSNNSTTPPKTTAKPKPTTPRSSKKKTSPVAASGPTGASTALPATSGLVLPQQQQPQDIVKEVKPKASRAKKNVTINTANNNNTNVVVPTDNTVATSKPESTPKRASKPRANASQKGAASSATSITANNGDPGSSSAQVDPTSSTPSKRKSRSSSNESSNIAPSPSKKPRKKKSPDLNVTSNPNQLNNGILAPTGPSVSGTNLLPPSSNLITTGPPNPMVGPSPLLINTPAPNSRYILGVNPMESQDMMNRYYSPMISPYTTNYDLSAAPVLSRSSISRLFASSSSSSAPTNETSQPNPDDPERLLDELKEQTWSHLSKCILDQAQQFEMPSLIGTLYTLRAENEKLEQRVRELRMKNDQLLSINARLDMPGSLMTQHLSSTSPNFSSVVAGLTQSPKNIPTPSPGSTMNKQSLISIGPYNHVPSVSIGGPPNFMDRGSPLIAQTHSGLNPNMKTSSISTPSPPIGTLIANRAGLTSVNPPYLQAAYNQPPPVSNPNAINDYRQMAPKGSGWAR